MVGVINKIKIIELVGISYWKWQRSQNNNKGSDYRFNS